MPLFTSKVKTDEILSFLRLHLVVSVIFSTLTLCFTDKSWALNFAIGQLYLWISLISLSLSVYLFFLKKNIALIVGVIVFKWPILIYVVYRLTQSVDFQPIALSLGFLPVVLSSLVWSVLQKE